jgi:hypothetical protein
MSQNHDALRDAATLARNWIAEKPELRPISAGKMCATLDRALAASKPIDSRDAIRRALDALDKSIERASQHPDDVAVDRFARAMKEKLAQARQKGRGGWQTCPPADLSRMLREHVEKGDPRDVANFCMFLWSLGQGIEKPEQQAQAVEPLEDWLCREMPAGTIIGDPKWWAPRIALAAQQSHRAALAQHRQALRVLERIVNNPEARIGGQIRAEANAVLTEALRVLGKSTESEGDAAADPRSDAPRPS